MSINQLLSKGSFVRINVVTNSFRGVQSTLHQLLLLFLNFFQTNFIGIDAHHTEYLLQCPSAEVRSAFVKILVFLAHLSLSDGPCEITLPSTTLPSALLIPSGSVAPILCEVTLADHIFQVVLNLLSKEVADYGRHLSQYFNLFLVYASLGPPEKAHLLRLNVLATFMTVALDEGPGPPIKYQYAELGKLYQVESRQSLFIMT